MKTIKLTVGMKLILVAVITIIGISLFSAFKQSEGSKKYLTMTVLELQKKIVVVDENGKIEEKKISSYDWNSNLATEVTNELNNISVKGYKLILTNPVGVGSNISEQYIFEKE